MHNGQVNTFSRTDRYDLGSVTAMLCPTCEGLPYWDNDHGCHVPCPDCGDVGFVSEGGEILTPTQCKAIPGTRERVVAMRVRYCYGVSLWDEGDAVEQFAACEIGGEG